MNEWPTLAIAKPMSGLSIWYTHTGRNIFPSFKQQQQHQYTMAFDLKKKILTTENEIYSYFFLQQQQQRRINVERTRQI